MAANHQAGRTRQPGAVRCLQLNAQHSRSATASLCRQLSSRHNTIGLIQEPWVVKNRVRGLGLLQGSVFASPFNGLSKPRTAIYIPKGIPAILLEQFSGADLTAVEVALQLGGKPLNIIVASCYLPSDSTSLPPSLELAGLIEHCKQKGVHCIIGCDCNSHHTLWGSNDNNSRGTALAEYLAGSPFHILNRGCEPTFVTSRGQSVIDITLATTDISKFIVNWQVSREETMSDHKAISFVLKEGRVLKSQYRNPRLTDRTAFISHLDASLGNSNSYSDLHTPIASVQQLDQEADKLQAGLVSAFEKSCPLKTASRKRPPWWCKDLERIKRETGVLFNRARKSLDNDLWVSYRDSRRAFKRLSRQRQRKAWRDFCSAVESAPEISRLQKILSKDERFLPRSLTKSDGSLTESQSETMQLLITTHFPDCKLVPPGMRWDFTEPTPPGEDDWLVATSVVDEEKIKWAIQSFSPFKSAGPDGIFPALLQWGIDIVVPRLSRIFKASLAHRYIPINWRDSKVRFIPKPGREDYTSTKSYRPISLSSFILKTLERLIDRYLRDSLKIEIHPNQHAFTAGRSTESALHIVVERLERSIGYKQSTLALFADIEGAFDKTTFRSVDEALLNGGANSTIRSWIKQLLGNRLITADVNDGLQRATVTRGCPQGGVLSPLLWISVANSLLHRLNSAGFYTVGYADDIAILISGNCEPIMCDLMQTAIKIVEDWCKENSLKVNPTKSELVLFTRKRKIESLKLPTLFDLSLNLKENVKYLGITLDKKLSWSKHIEIKTKKACRAFWQCRAALGSSWGPSPKALLWLYEAAILPMLTYGSLVWWKRTSLETEKKRLNHIQRLACIAISGAIRTTPTAAMEAALGLLPLDLLVQRCAVEAAARLKALNTLRVCSAGGSHSELIGELSNRIPQLSMPLDRRSPIHIINRSYKILLNGEPAVPANITVFTDGSCNKQGSGAGIFCKELNLALTVPLGDCTTAFQAELVAVTHCAIELAALKLSRLKINIILDCKSILLALKGNKCTSKLLLETHQALSEVALANELTIMWAKGHSDCSGNQEADRLAKKGAEVAFGPRPFVPLSTEYLHAVTKKAFLEMHISRWKGNKLSRHVNIGIPGPSKELTNKCLALNRETLSLYLSIITGHCGLKQHLHRMGATEDATCRGCEYEEESMEHVLCRCPRLEHLRGSILGESWPSIEDVVTAPPRLLVKLIKEIGWIGGRQR